MQKTQEFLSDEVQARHMRKFRDKLEQEQAELRKELEPEELPSATSFREAEDHFREQLRKQAEKADRRRHAARFAKTSR